MQEIEIRRKVVEKQDSCRTRNQDFVTPASYYMPIEGGEGQNERAPA